MNQKQIRDLIEGLCIPQTEFAKLIRSSHSAVAAWCNGARHPNAMASTFLQLLYNRPDLIQELRRIGDPDMHIELARNFWHHIDFVPKDGTPVDLWDGEARYPGCMWREWRDSKGWYGPKGRAVDFPREPTHFMIVRPPSDIGKREKKSQ